MNICEAVYRIKQQDDRKQLHSLTHTYDIQLSSYGGYETDRERTIQL